MRYLLFLCLFGLLVGCGNPGDARRQTEFKRDLERTLDFVEKSLNAKDALNHGAYREEAIDAAKVIVVSDAVKDHPDVNFERKFDDLLD